MRVHPRLSGAFARSSRKERAMKTFALALFAAVVAVGLLPMSALGRDAAMVRPAIEMRSNLPGKKVIATPARLGIYYWDVEKKAGGKIRCKGACLVKWPAVYVKAPVEKHVKGVMATFGTIKRGAKLQLTVNGLPAYTYEGDKAGIVKCDNVDGWHAVRVS
jgi:predicted lipoprotein with Yx(FWY)xxD motif